MNRESWGFVVELGIVSAALLLGTLLRATMPPLRWYLVPANLIGGVILLSLGASGLGWLVIDSGRLSTLVYHLLPLTYLAISFAPGRVQGGQDRVTVGLQMCAGIYFQAFVGLALVLTAWPLLHPGLGLLAPLGFGLGPGQAYSIGLVFEQEYGMTGAAQGANIGLVYAAFGFICSCLVGIPLANFGIRRGRAQFVKERERELGNVVDTGKRAMGYLTTRPEAVDTLGLHLGTVLGLYLVTFCFISAIEAIITHFVPTFSGSFLWGMHFAAANFVGVVAKRIVERVGISHLYDAGILNRLGGTFVDYMTVAALGAISLRLSATVLVPMVVIGTAAGFTTLLTVQWLSRWCYSQSAFEHSIAVFGIITGTFTTGFVLLRLVDPNNETPVMRNVAHATAFVIPPVLLPLFFLIHLPAIGYNQGRTDLGWVSLGLIGAMAAASIAGLYVSARIGRARVKAGD